MKRFYLVLIILCLAVGLQTGCKTVTTAADSDTDAYQMDRSDNSFSKIRPRDPDSESMGLSSKSRDIEKNLGIQ